MIFAKIVRQTKGANYRTGKEAREAWESGADFEVVSIFSAGKYCSIRDFSAKENIEIRFGRNDTGMVVVTGTTIVKGR